MALQALLLSRDPEVHRTLRRVLDAANIETELLQRSEQARQALSRGKYDAFLVDCDDTEEGPVVLKELRQGKSNKTCIAFAIVHGRTTVQQAFEIGAHFERLLHGCLTVNDGECNAGLVGLPLA